MAKIKAGDLRQVITLIRPAVTLEDRKSPGTAGTERKRRVTGWEDAATVRAAKSDVSGREFFEAHAVNAEDIVTFTIRWRPDIDTTWRVRHGGETYGILEVNHLSYMRDYIRLKCRSVKGGGI